MGRQNRQRIRGVKKIFLGESIPKENESETEEREILHSIAKDRDGERELKR